MIQRIWLTPGAPGAEVRVQSLFSYKVGFDEPSAFKHLTQVVGTLWEFHAWLQRVLEQFHDFQPADAKEFIETLRANG